MKRQMLARAALWLSGGSLILVAMVGLAHTRLGRPLLGLLHGAPGCPLQELDARELEIRRVSWGQKRAGAKRSRARPALGFELGVARKEEVRALFVARGAECKSSRRDTALECKDRSQDAYLQFDTEGRLVAVDLFHEPHTAAEAVEALGLAARALSSRVGPPTSSRGEHSEAFLSGAPFRQIAVEYRYSDYLGHVAATNLGSRGLRVREQYQWLPTDRS